MEKRKQTEETRSFPVFCRIAKESQVIKACILFTFSWCPLDTIEGMAYYSEPFPRDDHVNKFRVKLTYRPQKSSWFIHITSWKPVSLISRATIKYKVKVSELSITQTTENSKRIIYNKTTNATIIHPVTVYQQHYNSWMLVHEVKDIKFSKKLRLVFEVNDILIDESDSIQTKPYLIQRNKLSWLTSLVNSEDHRTVELIGKESCKVELLVQALSSSSEVFSRMFTENTPENLQWKESKEKRVVLQDMDIQDLMELKAYLYNAEAPEKSAAKLFALANVYQMEHLKFCCAEELYAQLKPYTAMEVLKLASHFEYIPLIRALWLYYEEHGLHLE